MSKLFLALLLLATSAFADQNPAPTNVGVSNQSTFTCTSTSTQAFVGVSPSSTRQRSYLLVQNTGGTNPVTIKFNSVQTGSEGVVIPANGSYEPHPALIGNIWCKSASGSTLGIVEGYK